MKSAFLLYVSIDPTIKTENIQQKTVFIVGSKGYFQKNSWITYNKNPGTYNEKEVFIVC